MRERETPEYTAETPRTDWHGLPVDRVLEQLHADRQGLTGEEAKRRLIAYGPNRLRAPERTGPLRRLLGQVNNVLIYILIGAGAVTLALGHFLDAGVIFGVVVINAIIGFIQEGKAERALQAIRDMLSPQALVLRDGHRRTIDAAELVPGDLVYLQAGDRVPADLRLVEARNLRVEEALLTGESVPVEKSIRPVAADASLGDRRSVTFSGTMVTYGIGVGVVVATGERTELGRISVMLREVQHLTTPLLRQMTQFGRWLSMIIVVVAVGTFAFGYFVRGFAAVDMFLAAVSFAVAAIPEGLPAIMTITLALGVQQMARMNAIIRRLPAVETLGSVTVICSDKTGTLTRNEMTVTSVATPERDFEVTGVGYAPTGGYLLDGTEVSDPPDPVLVEALRAGLLCNEASVYNEDGRWRMDGDPTEGALLTAALKAKFVPPVEHERLPRTDVIPFESEHRFMATLHHDHQGHGFVFVKGAPEKVLGMCARERTPGGDRSIDRAAWNRRLEQMASRGHRLLAVATREMDRGSWELTFEDVERDLVLLAVFGIIDPPREEAIEAVQQCRSAGVRVKMITGDHLLTARTVAGQLGIGDGGRAVEGHVLERCSPEDLQVLAGEVDVFARAAPEHKLRLVDALQARNEVVAMTGDGVNDAPALKRADIGVSMGIKGTEAAKEASEMVLADDNFASIAAAVRQGRTVYDNLKKAILFLLPTNGGQGATVVAGIALGLELPLTPVQVLWVNMVTAVTLALALAFEPTEPGVMSRPPRRPGSPLLSGFLLWRIAFVSLLLVIGTFGHFTWLRSNGTSLEVARTAAINTLVAGQVMYLFNSRHILASSLKADVFLGSRATLGAVGTLVALQMLFTYAPPLQVLFGTTGIGWAQWWPILAFSVALFLLVELEKAWLRRRHSQRLQV